MPRATSLRVAFLALSALVPLFLGSSAQAATRSMVGSIGVINPSVAPPFFFEVGPSVLGRGAGPYAPTKGWQTIAVAGTTPGTFVGRTLTLGAGQLDFSGLKIRDFPAFPNVANLTLSFRSTHEAVLKRARNAAGRAMLSPPDDTITF